MDDDYRIVITEADIDRSISLWEMKWKRLPTETELQGLINAQVREEILYREALAMGLDQDDTIVRRRMAQKVEFISDNIAEQVEPSDEQLDAYLKTYPEKFEIPGRVSFRQVYFNVDRRGAIVEQDAEKLLVGLRAGDDDMSDNMGDVFMFGNRHDSLSRAGVSRLFGKDFTEQLFAQATIGEWQGPLVSGYGLHLVLIDSLSAPESPDLDSVRDKVRQEWSSAERKRMNEAFFEQLRSRYEVVIEPVTPLKQDSVATRDAGEG
jgi:parvulin-like peptidyl-prolyl isomerase